MSTDHSKVQEMVTIMARHGWRITDQRRTLARIFASTEKHRIQGQKVHRT